MYQHMHTYIHTHTCMHVHTHTHAHTHTHTCYSHNSHAYTRTHTQDGEIPKIFTTCDSDAAQYWLPVLLAYKGLFLIVGIFLAAQTYNVKIKELRDSKLIVASVFGIAVISVVIAVVALAVRNEPVATYSVIGLFIMLLVTGILILLFVTRVS